MELTQEIYKWINVFNTKDIDGCYEMLDDSVELHSTLILKLFPESGGIIKGRKCAINYLNLIFEKFPSIIIKNPRFVYKNSDSIIMNANDGQGSEIHAQYFLTADSRIRMIKADIAKNN